MKGDTILETAPLPPGSTVNTWQARSCRYNHLAIFFLILNTISAILFISFFNRPIYDDPFNIVDVQRYASEGVSVETLRDQINGPGPSSFLWMAAAVRLLGGNELRVARVAVLVSWLLLGGGVLIGARYTQFPELWYSAFLVTLVFPHAATASASVLTEGPALLFATMGVLIWLESVSRQTITPRLTVLAILGGLFMGTAITCRQYYLMLLPAAALFALNELRRRSAKGKPRLFVAVILSLLVAIIPVILMGLAWKGLSSPGMKPGMWNTRVGLNFLRPIVAIFYVAIYLVPLTFPAMGQLKSGQRHRALLFAALAGVGATCFRTYLVQPGPLRSFISIGSRVPAGESIIFWLIAIVTLYNAIGIVLRLWEDRTDLFSFPPVVFALLAIVFFIGEQVGVGGNMPLYDRYVFQLAPFLGIVACGVLPSLTSQRLLALTFLSVVSQMMLWRHVLVA